MPKNKLILPQGTKVPDHVAMILDGNRRWARARGLKPWEGHKAGYEAVKKLAKASRDLGVHTFTVWAWSTENWDRAEIEISEIFKLLRIALIEMEKEIKIEKVRLVHLGRKDRLPADIVQEITRLEAESRKFTNHTFNIALDYGGKDEIIRAIKRLSENEIKVLDEKIFAQYLDTRDQPYPFVDLFIRTSGEQRTSGLLPWQMTYAEFYFEQDHLPDFTPEKLKTAIMDFSCRRRRFGGDDAVEHFNYDPRMVAKLDIDLRHEVEIEKGSRLSVIAIEYLKQQYGLSKGLARQAGKNLVAALVSRRKNDWTAAKGSLVELYKLIRKNVGLAMEPEIVASIEVGTWKKKPNEVELRELLSEKFRFSSFQAAKSAHLAFLADDETRKGNWERAKVYMEKYYQALKERVA